MKDIIKILFSIFFAIAIGVHIYYLYIGSTEPLWKHALYFLTYGTCWYMIYSSNPNSSWIYLLMALFPFAEHAYLGYLLLEELNPEFWVCLVVCFFMIAGFVWLRLMKKKNAIAKQGHF